MKKIFGLLIILLLLTGCDVKYNIEFTDVSVKEDLKINNLSNEEYKEFNNLFIPVDYEIDDYGVFKKKYEDIDYYNMRKFNDSVNFSYTFDYNDFGNSTFLNHCYDKVTFSRDTHELILSTSDRFLCFDSYDTLNSLEVVIKSDYKLLETNADYVDGNTYMWNITDSSKNILLRLDSNYESNYKAKTFIEKLLNSNFVIFTGIFVVAFIICYLLKKKGQFKNRV